MKKCIECGSENNMKYEIIKCKDCGYILKDFISSLEDGRIKIRFDKDKKEILVMGDKKGLEFLASCCLSIIGRNTPAGHIHLMKDMNNLKKGSVNTVIIFSDDPEDFS